MSTVNSFHKEAFEVSDAVCDMHLHLDAARALGHLIESTYFEPSAECFVKAVTVQHWEEIQLNMYTLINLIDNLWRECSSVEEAVTHLCQQSKTVQ